MLKNYKERPIKLEKGYSQVLVKQTVGLLVVVNYSMVDYTCSGECLQNNDVMQLSSDWSKTTDVVVYPVI